MLHSFFLFFLLSTISFSTFAQSDKYSGSLEDIAHHRTWVNLLYFNADQSKSEVVSDSYFLSPEGKNDPRKELYATLKAYHQPFEDDSNLHPQCRFPARYYWLHQQGVLPGYQGINKQCSQLNASLADNPLESLSLMFVTGYLGNPASSFGHSFIKLNRPSLYGEKNDLFDFAVSYGADVPDNENIFLYMYRGVFGGYVARFTDKYFYTQDLVYSSNEFRDIWEYELNLSNQQVRLFQLHLWEVLNKRFQYYFLNQNCGYEVSRLLQVVLEQDLAEPPYTWFAPIETFHTLSDQNQNDSLIKKVSFHPSERKKIYQKYQQLSSKERDVSQQLINQKVQFVETGFDSLSQEEQIEVLHFVAAYYGYLLFKEPDNDVYQSLKRKALLARFQLPIKGENELVYKGLVKPDENDQPSVFSVKADLYEKNEDALLLSYAPYALEMLGRNNLSGNELVVLKTKLDVYEQKVSLKRFDLINIKSFDRFHIPLNEELGISWQLDVALERTESDKQDYDGYVFGGAGKTWSPSRNWMTYAMLNGAAHSFPSRVAVLPEVGTRLDLGGVKAWASVKKELSTDERIQDWLWQAKISTHLAKDIALKVDVSHRVHLNSEIGLAFYF